MEFEIEQRKRKDELEIRGSMTLRQVASQYDVDISVLKSELNLPTHVSANDRLGILRKEYGFTMGEVKAVVLQYGKSQ
jgi:hypothetical protein